MGNKIQQSPLDQAVLDKLMEKTGLEREVIIAWRKQFLLSTPSGKMGRKDFFKFYRSLRVESDDKVKEIANFVFTAFDRDSNGKIDFAEFLCGYAITSLGTMRQKLDYVFAIYDSDKNDSIDRKEMIRVISAMYGLLGKVNDDYPPERFTDDVFSLFDTNKDRALTKDEFIEGVMKNPYLSDIISPFNE
ncbi:unnamed protein product [Rotaria magnacalcarata]|uniref:EF-hand domain-containing protein n=1 Tax=Rotaria magnacalcarata TaxID=392030 RepID=A0A815AL02_9BILA|nr:unnamed protein product [Rotaria magnacalcarata]CAF1577967.1 unnamed protein product [Rotaria magnacalcarata]CAF2109497.1 unnamed protein product [Rotaria magnacalcarata]CAF2217468.1 unnamed protein product [Rotaria magnacalcarata]CAF3805043.1 unnamed protein product [Rotaria magnacalcarata]